MAGQGEVEVDYRDPRRERPARLSPGAEERDDAVDAPVLSGGGVSSLPARLEKNDQGPWSRAYRAMPRSRPRPYDEAVSMRRATLGGWGTTQFYTPTVD
jgi:hypothetical protein